MNSKQKQVVGWGMVAFVLMLSYPPWVPTHTQTFSGKRGFAFTFDEPLPPPSVAVVKGSVEYASVFYPPTGDGLATTVYHIDVATLGIQAAVLLVLTLGMVFLCVDEKTQAATPG